jgi:cytoskeletal protein RodZ
VVSRSWLAVGVGRGCGPQIPKPRTLWEQRLTQRRGQFLHPTISSMLVSMPVRCAQCGQESDVRYRFCGMCGAKLPPPPAPSEPVVARPASAEQRSVSGPSILGLSDEPSSSVTYLLDDELSESHWGRSLILLIILAAIGFAAWHWRAELRAYVVGRLTQHPSSNQSEQASAPEAPLSSSAPTSTSGSGGAPKAPESSLAPTEKPVTGAGDTLPAAQTPSAPPSSPANNTPANSQQPSTSAPAASAPAPAQSNQAPPPTEPAAKAVQNESGDTERAKEEVPKAESAVTNPAKKSKAKVNETAPADSEGEQIEAQGEKYLYGVGVPVNCGRAQTDLELAAGRGNSKANSVLGTMYATGHCVPRDLPLAYRWFARALQHDPNNVRLQRDLQVLWSQMSAEERQIAMRR